MKAGVKDFGSHVKASSGFVVGGEKDVKKCSA